MDAKKIILSRLDSALRKRGVTLKRAALLETAAAAFGHHNSNEFTAALGRGDYDATAAAIASADPTPAAPIPHASEDPVHPDGNTRYLAFDPELGLLAATDDLDAAKAACRDGDRLNLSSYVVDRTERTILQTMNCWRMEPLVLMDDPTTLAALLHLERQRAEEIQNRLETTLRIDVPDWRSWEKDLKKASHKRQDPVSDEILHQIRHAVADVHCKSSASERSEVDGRQMRYVEKHLGGLLARLDRAEEALRDAGLAPKEIARKPKDDAAERLAAIEAVVPRRAGSLIPDLYEVDATRDGTRCREIFRVSAAEDPENRAREIAAREFRMDLEEHRDEDGTLDGFDGECDSFEVSPVSYPEAAAIIGDALADLSIGGDFRYGMPHSHPARIKLLAARSLIVPQPTV